MRTHERDPERKRKAVRRYSWTAVSYLVAAGSFFWVFRDIDLVRLWQLTSAINWWWACLGIALQVLTYVVVACEWQLLLRPVASLSLLRIAQAVFAGRFANDVLPIQLGYVIRAYLAGKWMKSGWASAMPSLAVERLLDGFWLAVGIALITIFVPLPVGLKRARDILFGVVIVGAGLMAIVVFRERRKTESASGIPSRWKWVACVANFLRQMVIGLRDIMRIHVFPGVLSLSVLKLLVQGLSFLSLMWAYGLGVSVWTGLAVFLIAYLGICIPSTPASAGIFQIFSIEGLKLFGIEKTAAAGFSLVAFAAFTVALSSIGFFALAQSGMTLRQIRNEIGGDS